MKKYIVCFATLAFIITASPAAAEFGGTITKSAVAPASSYQAAVNKIVTTFLQTVEWQTGSGTMKFSGNTYSVNLGCNTIFGTYTLEGTSLVFSEPAMTMMACEVAAMEQDAVMSKNLANVSAMKFHNGTLLLTGDDTTVTLSPNYKATPGK